MAGEISSIVKTLRKIEAAHFPEDERSYDSRLLIFSLSLLNYLKRLLPASSNVSSNGDLQGEFRHHNQLFYTSFFDAALHNVKHLPAEGLKSLCKEVAALEHPQREEIGYLYERFVQAPASKRHGVFYTPGPIVSRIVNSALAPMVNSRSRAQIGEMRVLDMACGSGVFLIEAFRFLNAHLAMRYGMTRKERTGLLQHTFCGVDRDQQAVELTKILLALEFSADARPEQFELDLPNLSKKLRSGNSLLDPSDFDQECRHDTALCKQLSAFSWPKSFPDEMQRGGFDCILGNPPYGLSRNEQIPAEENERLKTVYASYRSGKVNRYLSFMAKGYQLLRPGGTLSFIVPNAWLGIRGGTAMRKMLLEDGSLEEIVVFDCPVFDEPSVEAVIFRARKGAQSKTIRVLRTRDTSEAHSGEGFDVPTELCLKNPEATIPTLWRPELQPIFDILRANCMRLDDSPYFTPLIALQAYAEGKGFPAQSKSDVKNHVFHCTHKETPTAIPYLEGSDIRRYSCAWSGTFLKHGPWLAEPQSLERFEGPRILLREIINPAPYLLNATYVEEPFLYNKSVLHIIPKQECHVNLFLALLGILNSKFASFVIRFCGRKSQRKIFPKIVNDDLKAFPLPLSFADIEELAHLVRKQLEAEKLALSDTERNCLQQQIDAKVLALYPFKNSQVRLLIDALEAP